MEKNKYDIYARASPKLKLVDGAYYVVLNQFRYLLTKDIVEELMPINTKTTLFASAFRNNKYLFAKSFTVKDGRHAEELFLESPEFKNLVEGAKSHRNKAKTKLNLTLDKSTCSGEYKDKNCTLKLSEAIREHKDYLEVNITLIGSLARKNNYKINNGIYELFESQKTKIVSSIKKLMEAGAEIKKSEFFKELNELVNEELKKGISERVLDFNILKSQRFYISASMQVENVMRGLIDQAFKEHFKKKQ